MLVGSVFLTSCIFIVMGVPGYIARSFYHTKQLTKALLPKKFSEDLLASVFFSIPLHFLGILITQEFHNKLGIGPGINWDLLVHLITGELFKSSSSAIVLVENWREFWAWIGLYIFLVLGLAGIFGWIIRATVWHGKLDLRLPYLFRFGNNWVYRTTWRKIETRGIGFVGKIYQIFRDLFERVKRKKIKNEKYALIDILVVVNDKYEIYSGVLDDLIVDENGELSALVLTRARRGDREDVQGFEKIEGDLFIVKYSDVMNMNIFFKEKPVSTQEEVKYFCDPDRLAFIPFDPSCYSL